MQGCYNHLEGCRLVFSRQDALYHQRRYTERDLNSNQDKQSDTGSGERLQIRIEPPRADARHQAEKHYDDREGNMDEQPLGEMALQRAQHDLYNEQQDQDYGNRPIRG